MISWFQSDSVKVTSKTLNRNEDFKLIFLAKRRLLIDLILINY